MSRDVAYQGAPGAFAEEACILFLPEWRPVARPSFEAVIEAVVADEAGRGMLPLRNSIAGDVPGIEELIRGSGLLLLARHRLPVRLHLLGLPGASLETIRSVTSHPMALGQIGKWLEATGVTPIEASNTAVAAAALAESGDLDKGVIASESAARNYGLSMIQRDIHDTADNATTFGIVASSEADSG